MGEVITLTFGDMAENHVGMEQIGNKVNKGCGFHIADFTNIQQKVEELGIQTEIYKLSTVAEDLPDAYIMVLRNAIDKLMGIEGYTKSMEVEQKALDWDKKAKIYGRVVNKHARWNLCYDDKPSEPDYENGRGRVIELDSVNKLKSLRQKIGEYFGEKAQDLKVEGNYYYDINKCGIGFHGDSERRKVIGVRLGNTDLPLYYQWYKEGECIGEKIKIEISPGDIYIMDEKAVGTDWKQKKIPTLRHAAGAKKYIS